MIFNIVIVIIIIIIIIISLISFIIGIVTIIRIILYIIVLIYLIIVIFFRIFNIIIKIIPDMYDILSGSVKMTSIFGAPLIEISHNIMPTWQRALKRVIDITISMIALTFFSPVFIKLKSV